MSPSESIVPTPEQLRGLSHPVRVKLLGLLRMDGPQTSAELARATGLNTGATSYHLRQLALHGFVEDAPGLGSGRERHWRARHRSTQVEAAPATPGAEASLDDRSAWQQTVLSWTTGAAQAAHDEWTDLPPEWRASTSMNDFTMRLTAEQASEVVRRLHAALHEIAAAYPYAADGSGEPSGPDGSRHPDEAEHEQDAADGRELWAVHLLAFPVPGRIPHRGEQ